MFEILTAEELRTRPALAASMFRTRAAQFAERHKWAVRVDSNGWELDEYDDSRALYCVVHNGERHLASLRLRPTDDRSMLEDHFAALWESSRALLSTSVEVTRFCADQNGDAAKRQLAVFDLLLGLCRYCVSNQIRGIFGIVFPAVARNLRTCGWAPETIGIDRQEAGTLLLAEWQASEFVAWDIQEKRERRENALSQRLRASAPDRSVA